MKKEYVYYKYLDIIRIVSCIFILLYHLGILKGGYLAVCSFFAISGYLACISAFKCEKFSLKKYYLNQLFKIYIPLIIVIFVTIAIISFIHNIIWLNLKPETTSILLGYNNFWQISVNLDYFAHQIASPFMHLWFLSIIVQFELVFPFVYILLKKLGDKFSKIIPILIIGILTVASIIYFYITSSKGNFMFTYYSTFTRCFSLLFGMLLGFIHSYYGTLASNKVLPEAIFFFYLTVLCILFCLVDASSIFLEPCMIITTLITLYLIDYSIVLKENVSKNKNIIKNISSITYEIYLWQYPVIFIFQTVSINKFIKIPLLITIIVILSILLHFILNKCKKLKELREILLFITIILTSYGVFKYITSNDYTKEMNELKYEMSQNEKIMQDKLKEYEDKFKKEQDDYKEALKEIDNDQSKLEEYVKNLSIVGIGDSVMLGAVPNLYKTFKNGYFDAQVSRTAWVVSSILNNLKSKKMLANPIVLHLGTNGDCTNDCKNEIMKICENKEVFWINVTNDNEVHINKDLSSFANKYKNLHIIDWNSISKGHNDYFVSDGIHLTEKGRNAYVNAIYNSIYKFYLEMYQSKREEIINQYNDGLKNKISFYGNDLLINAYNDVSSNFINSKFIINKDYNYELLKKDLETAKKEETLSKKIVLVFDKNMNLDKNKLNEIIKLCSDSEVYLLSLNKDINNNISSLQNNNLKIIEFYKEIDKNKNYLMADKIHLTSDGNKALGKILLKYLN